MDISEGFEDLRDLKADARFFMATNARMKDEWLNTKDLKFRIQRLAHGFFWPRMARMAFPEGKVVFLPGMVWYEAS